MSAVGRLALACALILTATGAARAQPVTAPAAPAEATAPLGLGVDAEAPVPVPAPPSMAWIVWRVVVALAVVGGLLAVTLAMLRSLMGGRVRLPAVFGRGRGARAPRAWLALWNPAGARAADRLEILDRRPVGAKESVCLVRAGHEQFLIGVTVSRISLLGRLAPIAETGESAEAAAPIEAAAPLADVDEPAATDFARGLAGPGAARPSQEGGLLAASSRSGPDEASFRLLLARSRDRLSRLGLHEGHAGARRD